jgi:hypothetical protein
MAFNHQSLAAMNFPPQWIAHGAKSAWMLEIQIVKQTLAQTVSLLVL